MPAHHQLPDEPPPPNEPPPPENPPPEDPDDHEPPEETAKRYKERGLAPPRPEESFHNKRVGQRAAIVAAGPAANYVFAVLIFAALFVSVGQRVTTPVIGEVIAGSVAEKAGFRVGDTIVGIDDQQITRFEQIIGIVQLHPGVPMKFVVARDGTVSHCHARDASWFQWPLLEAAIEGNIVADFPLCNKSFNCSYSGHDS